MNSTNGKKYRLIRWYVALGLIGSGLEEEATTYSAGPGAIWYRYCYHILIDLAYIWHGWI